MATWFKHKITIISDNKENELHFELSKNKDKVLIYNNALDVTNIHLEIDYKDFSDISEFIKTSKNNNMDIESWSVSEFGWDGIMGVYAVCSIDNQDLVIHYIGSSKNIGKRLNNLSHPYRVLFEQNVFVHIRYFETSDYKNIEKLMINKFNPILNKQHIKK